MNNPKKNKIAGAIMAVTVAEYLGNRTDIDDPLIERAQGLEMCPFMHKRCAKLKKGDKPICSVRKNDGTIWIVCPHRLCSTESKDTIPNSKKKKPIPLKDHQIDILWKVATTIYKGTLSKDNIGIRREVALPISGTSSKYHADYVMRTITGNSGTNEVLLEIQGGGETSSTGSITRKVTEWESDQSLNNEFLRGVTKASPIATNAWRRQQEQFLVKGNIVSQTGGKLVFAIGTLLFDYLQERFIQANLNDLREHNWTLCLMAFCEDKTKPIVSGPIPFVVDESRLLFTNYSTFVRMLTDQGSPYPQMFKGTFTTLTNTDIIVE